jgi:hypothetical protein
VASLHKSVEVLRAVSSTFMMAPPNWVAPPTQVPNGSWQMLTACMVSTLLKVGGITNKAAVKAGFQGVEGIGNVVVILMSGIVMVIHDPQKIGVGKIQQIISDLGFDAEIISTGNPRYVSASDLQGTSQTVAHLKEHQEVGVVVWQIVQDAFKRIEAFVNAGVNPGGPFLLLLPASGGGALDNLRDSCLDVLIRDILSASYDPKGLFVEIDTGPWAGLLWESTSVGTPKTTEEYLDLLTLFLRGSDERRERGIIFYPLTKDTWKDTEVRTKRDRKVVGNEDNIKNALGAKLVKDCKVKAGEIFGEVSLQQLGSSRF